MMITRVSPKRSNLDAIPSIQAPWLDISAPLEISALLAEIGNKIGHLRTFCVSF